MKKLIALSLIIVIIIPSGCAKKEKRTLSDNFLDCEAMIDGALLPDELNYDFFLSLGFIEEKRQACDACDKDIIILTHEELPLTVQGTIINISEKNKDDNWDDVMLIYSGGGPSGVELSGGIVLGQTTEEDLEEIFGEMYRPVKDDSHVYHFISNGKRRIVITMTDGVVAYIYIKPL